MIDISGRAVRAGIRSITAVAAASCLAVMPQVTSSASAHTGGKSGRAHDRTTPHRDHDGREGGEGRDHARDHARGRADVVVDTRGPRGEIVPGKPYKWPFEVTNRGTAPARDVALTATPDKHLKVLSVPPKCHQRKSGPLVCQIGLLPQGKSRHGVFTATVVPKTRAGKALSNPIQVSWHNAPRPERRLATFPPVEVSPDGSAPEGATGALPYPLMVTEHGPGTAESVVVRSPIGAPAAEGPCSAGVLPGKVAGKSAPIKPAFGSCAAKQDDPAACGCGTAAHQRPASDLPTENAVIPDRPAKIDLPAPCGAAADRPVVIPDRPVTPPCAGVPERPTTVDEAPATPPCAVRPVAPERPAEVPPCAQGRPAQADDEPATPPCGVRPEHPAAVPPCAQDRPAEALPAPIIDRPVDKPADQPASKPVDKPADKPADEPATTPCGAPVIVPERPAEVPPCAGKPAAAPTSDKPVADQPAATPCGAAAAKPVDVPGQPVVVPDMPAIPPCALGRPSSHGACGCLHSDEVPAAPVAQPAPQAPAVPIDPAQSDVGPCGADKPMAGKSALELPTSKSCASDSPAAVHEEPGNTPDTVAPMTPLTGEGKAAHHPLGRPHHHRPVGRPHRDCVRQGTGFVCPLGSAPHHPPRAHNLGAPGHGLHCVGAPGAACHTRAAQPVPVREVPGHELPTTGSSSALLALSGLGLAGAGAVLYRLSRTRRQEG